MCRLSDSVNCTPLSTLSLSHKHGFVSYIRYNTFSSQITQCALRVVVVVVFVIYIRSQHPLVPLHVRTPHPHVSLVYACCTPHPNHNHDLTLAHTSYVLLLCHIRPSTSHTLRKLHITVTLSSTQSSSTSNDTHSDFALLASCAISRHSSSSPRRPIVPLGHSFRVPVRVRRRPRINARVLLRRIPRAPPSASVRLTRTPR